MQNPDQIKGEMKPQKSSSHQKWSLEDDSSYHDGIFVELQYYSK